LNLFPRVPEAGEPSPRQRENFAVAAEVEARACFGAAVHGAHRLLSVGRKGSMLEYWLERALQASPGIAETLLDFVEARSSPVPAILSLAQQENRGTLYPFSLQQGWKWDGLDAEVLLAVARVLEKTDPGQERAVQEIVSRYLALGESFLDLSRPPYLWEPLERFYPEAMPSATLTGRAFLRSPWPTSEFCLVTAGGGPVELLAEMRLPTLEGTEKPREGQVAIEINGIHQGELRVGEAWSCQALTLSREVPRPGLNRLTIRWPMPPPVGEQALKVAVGRLEQGIEADLHPTFGEIFRLLARCRRRDS